MIDINAAQNPAESMKDLDELTAQEEELQFDAFSAEDAIRLAEQMVAEEKKLGIPVAIRIVLNGYTVFQYLPEGTGKLNELWMEKKVKTVQSVGWSTMRFWAWKETVEGSRRIPELLPMADVVPCGGGFPIRVKGCGLVGVIAVSGPGDQLEHDFIVESLQKLL